MEIFKVMTRNRYSGIEYADSYWRDENKAKTHVEHQIIVDKDTEQRPDEWYYWISKTETQD